jgi:hypothetical protein
MPAESPDFSILNETSPIGTSKALWLPVVYLWILGSRPVSVWLGITPDEGTDSLGNLRTAYHLALS